MNCSATRCTDCGSCKPVDGKKITARTETTFVKALRVHGHMKQALKATEELSELSIELTKFGLGDSRSDRMHILEELVDVEIMLKQIKLIFDFTPEEIIDMKAKKIYKLETQLQKIDF